jgi:hypothetical protein
MSNSIVASQGLATVTLTAGQSIALNSLTETTVFEQVGFPNYPSQNDLEATFTGYDVLGPYASGATLVIEAGAAPVAYQVGIAPVVAGVNYQATPTSQRLGCHADDCQGDVRCHHQRPTPLAQPLP